MKADTFYTDHQVDDKVVLSNDEAMDLFRKNFKYRLGCYVMPDGNIMRYSLGYTKDTFAIAAERIARQIIKEHSLPLEANLEVWSRGGFTFEVNLEIRYKP